MVESDRTHGRRFSLREQTVRALGDVKIRRVRASPHLRPFLSRFPENAAALTEGAGTLGYVRASAGLTLLMQLALGVTVAARSQRAGELHALLASAAAGMVMASSMVAVNGLQGGPVDLKMLRLTTKIVVSPGVFVAFLAAAVTATIRWSRGTPASRHRMEPSVPAPAPRPDRPALPTRTPG